jgi:hypothetical protein
MGTTNTAKPIRLLELSRPVGTEPAYVKVWDELQVRGGDGSAHEKPVALLIGVSGVGKTRTAYDIGLRHAFAVIVPVWNGTDLSLPWAAYLQVAQRVSTHVSDSDDDRRPPLPDSTSLLALLATLLTAHLEWALDVSEAALACAKDFADTVETIPGGSDEERRVRALREVVLRAQRNGEAEVQVRYRFARTLHALIDRASSSASGRHSASFLGFGMQEAKEHYDLVAARVAGLWRDSPVLWAHDEVQALLRAGELGRDFFEGAVGEIRAREGREVGEGEVRGEGRGAAGGDAQQGPPPGGEPSAPSGRRPAYGNFYGLLAAIRLLTSWERRNRHMLTGTYFELSDEALAAYSPAQGLCTVHRIVVNLETGDLREWLADHLTPAAMEGVSEEALQILCGRPLFATLMLSAIIAECAESRADRSPKELVETALAKAARAAQVQMTTLVSSLLDRHEPVPAAGATPSELVMRLFYSTVVDVDLNVTSKWRPALIHAVERGVLNGNPTAAVLHMGREAPTKAAIVREVLSRVGDGDNDPVMRALVREATSAVLPERSDKGPALETCLLWYLLRACIKPVPGVEVSVAPGGNPTGKWVSLSVLLHRLHACSASTVRSNGFYDPSLLPGDDYEALLTHGRRCDGDQWTTECAFRILLDDPHAVLHHPTDAASGPDIVFLVRHRVRHDDTRLVGIQCKNRIASTVREALDSLDFGQMYPDIRSGETEAHKDLRRLLRSRREWAAGAFRVVASARGCTDALLVDTAWYNQTAESPVFLLHVRSENFGADIFDHARGEQDISDNWPRPLFPIPVPHWADPLPPRGVAALPPAGAPLGQPPAQLQSRLASVNIKLSSPTATQAILQEIASSATGHRLDRSEVTLHRFLGVLPQNSITIHFRLASEAFRVFRWFSARPQPIDGHLVAFSFAF